MTNNYPDNWSEIDTVLCHDWLTGMRGGERVLEILCSGFPNAPIYSLIHNRKAMSDLINSHEIKTSWLQNIPGICNNYRSFLPVFPSAIENMKTPEADLIISTSHCVAKGLKAQSGTKHICYCFTPMRYAWTFYEEYFGNNPIKAAIAKPLLASLRKWDKSTANRVDMFIGISKHIQKRIKDFYGRDSELVYPPVDTERCTPGKKDHDGFDLIVSAIVPYKRVDLAVRAYSRTSMPLKIVGVGSGLNNLKSIASDNIEFLEWQSDERILELYRSCRMLIFPGEEDFGIVPVEAQACGRPVVAFAKGGALETVEKDVSGIFFEDQTEESLIAAVEKCADTMWDMDQIRANTDKFSTQSFVNGISTCIKKALTAS